MIPQKKTFMYKITYMSTSGLNLQCREVTGEILHLLQEVLYNTPTAGMLLCERYA